ncbi:hypothetical protein ACHAWF_016220 [Thalassiosira exigua]
MASYPNPSYQDTLLELYGGRRRKSAAASVLVHDNGSPFLPAPNPPPSPSPSPQTQTTGNPRSPSGGSPPVASAGGSASKKKKKLGSSYHFIPRMGKQRGRGSSSGGYDSDSEGEDDAGICDSRTNGFAFGKEKSESGANEGNGNVSSLSDQEVLKGIFANNHEPTAPRDNTHASEKKLGEGNILDQYSAEVRNSKGQLKVVDSSQNAKGSGFSSPLGQRIWRQYQEHLADQLHAPVANGSSKADDLPHPRKSPSADSYRLPPSRDFLRLPPTMVQIPMNSPDKAEWVNMEELGRKVLQCHLDLEASEPAKSPLMADEIDDSAHSNPSKCLSSSLLTSECFSRVIERDPHVGLGMSLREFGGCVYVQALLRTDGLRIEGDGGMRKDDEKAGPAVRAGLLVGDRLLGLNGRPFLKGRLANREAPSQIGSERSTSSEEILKSVGDAISNAKSPMVLHVQRESDRGSILAQLKRLQTEFKEKKVSVQNGPSGPKDTSISFQTPPKFKPNPKPRGPFIHPFSKALASRNLIKKGKEELLVTKQLRIFTDRTRQWESKLSFRLRASDFTLRPLLDARDVEPSYYASFLTDDGECPPFFDYKFSKSLRAYAPSTPMIEDWRLSRSGGDGVSPARRISRQFSREAAIMADLYAGLDKDDAEVQDLFLGGRNSASGGEGAAYPLSIMRAMSDPSDVFVPLMGVRKAICVRIMNTFLDNRNRTAFTIWCYDVESGMEWYAPVRYYNDFRDLRTALIRVDKTIGDIPFPSLGWSLGFASEAKESAKTKEARRSQLEVFLRRVFAGMYRAKLHPFLAEVAVHLQTFVGCDTVLGEGDELRMSLSKQVAISESTYGKRTPDPKSEPDNNAQMHLKRSIMRYCYRLFLLPSVEQLVSQFIDAAIEKVTAEAMGPATRKRRKGEATKDVEKIRDFIDQVQELILEGCHDDFVSMSQRRDFAALVDDLDNSVRDGLFREAVREQTELEVYVPLRSTISKYLVYAWYNEDQEVKHKMKALAEKPQSYFRIPKEHRSRSDWKSVSRILQEGVGRSTLPCVKLRAVVDAAKEITQLDSEERSVFPDASFFDGKVVTKTKALGADDFLPIFIFCLVRAKIERPSALCELLSLMCDPAKMNGETGYYLASFHAALTHIHELDMTEAENDLR